MSCCTIEHKKDKAKTNKNLELLRKEFDEVTVEKKEMYQLVTLRDKAMRDNYDWVVWLQIKVAYGNTNGCNHDSEHKLNGALEKILDWLPLLKGFEKSKKPTQPSLFGESDEPEFEKEPESPQGGEDTSWSKYWRELHRVRKSNLMKQYSFFELFSPIGSWWSYNDTDFSHVLPTNEEMLELAKEYLSGEIRSDILNGNEPFKDEYGYLINSGPISDIELKERIKAKVSFSLVPYHKYKYLSIDNSYTTWELGNKLDYRFSFSRGKISNNSWDNREYPSYKLDDPDFLQWVRGFFDIPKCEPISDEQILKENIEYFMNSMLWYGQEEYDWKEKINSFKDWKQFKVDILRFLKEKGIDYQNGGCTGYSIDGFHGDIALSRKGNVRITQKIEDRIAIGRNVDGLKRDNWDEEKVVVFDIYKDEIYKKAYELFYVKKEKSLLDFLAA